MMISCSQGERRGKYRLKRRLMPHAGRCPNLRMRDPRRRQARARKERKRECESARREMHG